MTDALNAFSRDLYGHVAGGDSNLVVSPLGAYVVLQLAGEGARGETAAVLRVGGTDTAKQYRALRSAIEPPDVKDPHTRELVPAYDLEIADAVWGHASTSFEAPFVRRVKEAYGATFARTDFAAPERARREMSAWVAKATHGRIEEIAGAADDTRLLLANAIYLKARWQHPFEERATRSWAFTHIDGTTTETRFMHAFEGHPHAEVDGIQILELGYLSNRLAMLIYLPPDHTGLEGVEAALRAGRLDAPRTMKQVDVALPRFELQSDHDLVPSLRAMGLRRAFGAEADLSGMAREEPLQIGGVNQCALVEVDEAGTTAVAVTEAITKWGWGGRELVQFRADHPFAFEIRHTATGAILFAGRVTRP